MKYQTKNGSEDLTTSTCAKAKNIVRYEYNILLFDDDDGGVMPG